MERNDKIATLLGLNEYHTPVSCKKCRGVMIFKGVGEYRCEDCGNIEYDDYGLVRKYIEENRGCNSFQVSVATGVSHAAIRNMLKEGRFEISADSRTFLNCELCGEPIRSGRLCPKCETAMHRQLENEQRSNRQSAQISGHGLVQTNESGAKRFHKD